MTTSEITPISQLPFVNIHCDGSCLGNPGPGGWAAMLTSPRKNKQKTVSGNSGGTTTNNRMELAAAIGGLSALKMPCRVMLHSDSSYLVHTMSKGWQRKTNQDLWEQLDKLAKTHSITWILLGRNSTPELEQCDRLAREAATELKKSLASG